MTCMKAHSACFLTVIACFLLLSQASFAEETSTSSSEAPSGNERNNAALKKHQDLIMCVVCEEMIQEVLRSDCDGKWRCIADATYNSSQKLSPTFGQEFMSSMMQGVQTGLRKMFSTPKKIPKFCDTVNYCRSYNSRPNPANKCKKGHCTFGNHVRDLLVEMTVKASSSSSGNIKGGTRVFAALEKIAKQSHREGEKIPRLVHIMFGFKEDFGGKPFLLVNYLSVKSVHDRLNVPIVFYYAYEPKNDPYWTKTMALPNVIPVKVTPVVSISGKPVNNVAHKADVFRLMLLRDLGGVYFDIDVIAMNPQLWESEPLWGESFVIGSEGTGGKYGLCNAIMLSEPNSHFIQRWMKFYVDAFEEELWSMHSVKLPSLLAVTDTSDLTVKEDSAFLRPLWDELDVLYKGQGYDFSKNYAFHFWESMSGDYIVPLTEEKILKEDNNFNNAVRDLLLRSKEDL